MRLLGVSCDYHDAAAALVVDGRIVAAVEEERLSRRKHDDRLPERAIASCLAIGELHPDDLDAVVFHEKPLVVAGRVLSAAQHRGPGGLARFSAEMPVLLQRNLLVAYRLERALRRLGATRPPVVRYGVHHLSHAAAAFLPSPFETAAVLTVDGIGEWATASVGHGLHHRVDLLEEQRYPHSLGLLYSLVTRWCGFRPNDGEYKLMGLAPFGRPRYAAALAELVEVDEQGALRLAPGATRWWGSRPERVRRLRQAFDGPPRRPEDPVGEREADLARSVQELTETAVLAMAAHAHRLTGERRLCLGGGVALNCVANGRILREGPFEELWVQPAPGDAGSAVGAALWYWHQELGNPRPRDPEAAPTADAMAGGALGPAVRPHELDRWLAGIDEAHRRFPDPAERCEAVAERIAEGAVVGWFEGRMEFGPRALGHRSIVADPRSTTVRDDLNRRVKGRESFRPFAPSVLWEHAGEWFDLDAPSPYMLTTTTVAEAHRVDVDEEPTTIAERLAVVRSELPACTHVDGTARVQTVHRELHPRFHQLIDAFHRRTGCPVLVNTSFNRAGEPIVATPDQALATARAAGLDLLVVEDACIELRSDRR